MGKRRINERELPDIEKPVKQKEPKVTHTAYITTLWIVILGLVAQLIIAMFAYPILPSTIPSGWAGSAAPHNPIPSYVIFLLFPGAQIVLILLTIFSPKDNQGRRIMEHGKSISIVLLTLLFTALQASAFHIPKYGI
jgi:hypothetical protein